MRHLAIIMDGNGRWATERGLSRLDGHKAGAEAVLRAISVADRMGLSHLTLYAFSTENFKRNQAEVMGIFGIISEFLTSILLPLARKKGYRLRFIGEFRSLNPELMATIAATNAAVINNHGMTVTIAIGYGAREEIARTVQTIVRERLINCDDSPVTYREIERHLYTAGLPDPDAIVRYGGYRRLSNFLLLQSAYAELFFLDKYWPDFQEEDLRKIEEEFMKIKRNFGGVE